jgi:glutathione S-transferase
MKLYGSYTSPFVRHVRIVLLETRQEFEFIETDQAGSAAQSPTQRVPFLQDGDIFLTDSASIIKYLREKVGQTYCQSAQALDQLCLVNTALDTTVNLFFIKRDGVDITQVPYLQRQAARVQSTLAELNQGTITAIDSSKHYNDAQLRLACFISWSKFRQQIDFSAFANLENFYHRISGYAPFAATQPPQS